MNRKLTFVAILALAGLALVPASRAAEMSEKEKALANPYPNDYGPETLPDDVIKAYPANVQEGYKKLIDKKGGCAQCHSSARPLNSRFVEPEGKDDAAQDAWIAKMKKESPDLFKDNSIAQVETKVWSRYVKRMMNKPGCNLDKANAKKIYEFLSYDSTKRKTGANAEKWAAHRKSLIEKLKTEKPARYKELQESKDL